MSVERKQWEPPVVQDAGNVTELVQHGVGKTVVLQGDSGEPLKNSQQDAS